MPFPALMRRLSARGRQCLQIVWPDSLWPRLMLLLLAAMGPLLALLGVAVWSDGNRVMAAARQQALDMARLGAEQQGDALQEATSLLRVLARVPLVRAADGALCSDLLRNVVMDLPRVAAVSVADAAGSVVCSSRTAGVGLNVADRSFFQDATGLADGAQFALSELAISRVSGKPTLFVAVPVTPDDQSEPSARVVFATLNLEWFARLRDHAPKVQDQLIEVLDSRDGALLARVPGDGRLIGLKFPDNELIGAFQAAPAGGVVTSRDLDGVERIFGFAPLPGRGHGPGLVIAVGLAVESVRAAADARYAQAMGIGLAVAALAVLIAWLVAQHTLLGPIGALSAAASRVGAGDLTSPAQMGRGAARELQALASTFTRMAKRLRARDSRIAAMQVQLAASEGHHRLLADSANDMITRFSSELRRVYVSPACRDLLGYEPEELTGNKPGGIVHPDDWERLDATLNQPLLAGQPTARATYRAIRKDGTVVWLESSGRRLADGTGIVVVTRDVSERKALEEQLAAANRKLRVLVRQDGLTGLANRRRFDELLGREYHRAMRSQAPVAVIMLDVDRFKAFNDAYGHPAGDACLQALATAIDSVLRRPGDLAARYGGEEFSILLPNTGEAGAIGMAEQIRAAVRAIGMAHRESDTGIVTVSMGVAAVSPQFCEDGPAALVEAADAALYIAKRSGRDRIQVGGLHIQAAGD